MIRIATAKDISRLAEALKAKIELVADFKVCLIANSGKTLIREHHKNHNIDIPEMDGVEATLVVTSRWPNIRDLVSSVYDDEEYVFEAIMAGAMGYLLKDERPEEIHKSMHQILEGGVPMSPLIARKSLMLIKNGQNREQKVIVDVLSTRENEILEHLSNGLSYEQAAIILFISRGTVRKHIENIYRQLQVNNKVEAIRKLGRNGMV